MLEKEPRQLSFICKNRILLQFRIFSYISSFYKNRINQSFLKETGNFSLLIIQIYQSFLKKQTVQLYFLIFIFLNVIAFILIIKNNRKLFWYSQFFNLKICKNNQSCFLYFSYHITIFPFIQRFSNSILQNIINHFLKKEAGHFKEK